MDLGINCNSQRINLKAIIPQVKKAQASRFFFKFRQEGAYCKTEWLSISIVHLLFIHFYLAFLIPQFEITDGSWYKLHLTTN